MAWPSVRIDFVNGRSPEMIKVRGFAPIGMMECWNSGIMGLGMMQCWVDGKIFVDGKINNEYLPYKNQHSSIPPFHYSMVGART